MSASALAGLGTAGNPYIVTTWDQFDQLMRLDEGKTIYIELGNDIEWSSTQGAYFGTAIPVTGNIVLDLKGHLVHKYHDSFWSYGRCYNEGAAVKFTAAFLYFFYYLASEIRRLPSVMVDC
ncbi:MAG: hypothetical protein J5659_02585 [Clostridia bacterium]|nr:hypothetical protein [Clostridia bacterium]